MYRFTAVALLAMSAGHALHAQETKAEARVVVVVPEAGAKSESKVERRTFRIGAEPNVKTEARVVLVRPDGEGVEEIITGAGVATDAPGERRVIIRRAPDARSGGKGDGKSEKTGEARFVIVGPDGTKAEWTTEGAVRGQATEKDGKRSIKVVIEENGETHVFDGDDIASLEFLPESVRKWMTADGDGPRMLRFFRDGADAGDKDAPAAFRFRAREGAGAGFNWQEHAKELEKHLEGLKFDFDFDFDFDTDSIMESVHGALAEAMKHSGLSKEDHDKVMKALEGLHRGGAGQGGPIRGRMQHHSGGAGAGDMPEAMRQRIDTMRGRLQQQQERAEVERRRAEETVREREHVIRERFQARQREQAHAAPQPPTPPAAPASGTDARIKSLEERIERIERMLERLVTRG